LADRPTQSARDAFADRPGLRRALRAALAAALPELRIVAEDFLAEATRIDLLAVGAEGELVSIRIAAPGDDAAALTRALADLSWLRSRRADLLKLAPGLGIDPSAEPRALLAGGDFGAETRAAADNFPEAMVSFWRHRPLTASPGGPALALEPLKPATLAVPVDPPAAPAPSRAGRAGAGPHEHAHDHTHDQAHDHDPVRSPSAPSPRRGSRGERALPLTDPPSPSAFRTGLADADLEGVGPT